MKKKIGTAGQILMQSLETNPKLPDLTRHVMARMATGDEAAAAWRVLGEDEDTVNRVMSRIRTAVELALKEIDRPNEKDERQDIDHIIKLANDLKRAIKASSLPGDWCRQFEHELKAEGQPPVSIELGWHSLPPGGYGIGYPLAVVGVLDWAIDMARDHANQLPVRAVLRRRGKHPEVAAFVRHLAWQFGREYGKEM